MAEEPRVEGDVEKVQECGGDHGETPAEPEAAGSDGRERERREGGLSWWAWPIALFAAVFCVAVVFSCAVFTFELKMLRLQEAELVRRATTIVDSLAANDSIGLVLTPREFLKECFVAQTSGLESRSLLQRITQDQRAPANVLFDLIVADPDSAALKIMNCNADGVRFKGDAIPIADGLREPHRDDRADEKLWLPLDGVLRDLHDADAGRWAYEAEFERLHDRLQESVIALEKLRKAEVRASVHRLHVHIRHRLLRELFAAFRDYYRADASDVLLEVLHDVPELGRYEDLARKHREAARDGRHEGLDGRFVTEVIRRDPDFGHQGIRIAAVYCDSIRARIPDSAKHDSLRRWLASMCQDTVISRLDSISASVGSLESGEEGLSFSPSGVPRVLLGMWQRVCRASDVAGEYLRHRADRIDALVLVVYVLLAIFFFIYWGQTMLYRRFCRQQEEACEELLRFPDGKALELAEAFFGGGADRESTGSNAASGRLSLRDYIRVASRHATEYRFHRLHEDLLLQYESALGAWQSRSRETLVWVIRLGIIGTLIGIGQAFHEMIGAFATGHAGADFKAGLIRSICGNAVAVLTSVAAHGVALGSEMLLGAFIWRKLYPVDALRRVYRRLLWEGGGGGVAGNVDRLQHHIARFCKWIRDLEKGLPTKTAEDMGKKMASLLVELQALSAALEELRTEADGANSALSGLESSASTTAGTLDGLSTSAAGVEGQMAKLVGGPLENLREQLVGVTNTLKEFADGLPSSKDGADLAKSLQRATVLLNELVDHADWDKPAKLLEVMGVLVKTVRDLCVLSRAWPGSGGRK